MTIALRLRDDLTAFGMLLRGDRIPGVTALGEPRSDDPLLLLFNKGADPVDVGTGEDRRRCTHDRLSRETARSLR